MSRLQFALSHRERMSRYYGYHSRIYDATRWAFLFGRNRLVADMVIRPNETVLEIGCGTGKNFDSVQIRLAGRGRLLGVDCSAPMLAQAARRVQRNAWSNIELIDQEYGARPIAPGQVDVVLMSYSLSMIPNWQQALRCAKAELRPSGRIGIVDFCGNRRHAVSRTFEEWLRLNHVETDRPYENVLMSMFSDPTLKSRNAFCGLWSYFRFKGSRLPQTPS